MKSSQEHIPGLNAEMRYQAQVDCLIKQLRRKDEEMIDLVAEIGLLKKRNADMAEFLKALESANEELAVDNYNLEREVKKLKQANMNLVCDNDDLKDEIFELREDKENDED